MNKSIQEVYIETLEDRVENLLDELASKQAAIDELMLEYCPDEMLGEQKHDWEQHQKRVEVKL